MEEERNILSKYDDLSSGDLIKILFELIGHLDLQPDLQVVARTYKEDGKIYFSIETLD